MSEETKSAAEIAEIARIQAIQTVRQAAINANSGSSDTSGAHVHSDKMAHDLTPQSTVKTPRENQPQY